MSNNKRIAKNSSYLFALTISNYFVGLILFPFISRSLSIEGFGLIGFGMTFAAIFQSIVEYGFMISTTAEISKNRNDPKKVSLIISRAILAKTTLAIAAAFVFLIMFLLIENLARYPILMSLFFLSGIAASMVPDFYFRGVEKMQTIAIRAVSCKAISILIVVILVEDDSDIIIIPAALLIGNIISAALAFYYIRKDRITFRSVSRLEVLFEIKKGFLLFLSRIAVTLNQSIGIFALGFKFTPTSSELGIYTAATRIAAAGEMMVIPVSDSLYPHMISRKDYKLFKKIYIYGLITWLLCCIFVFIFANLICSILLGPAYESAGDYLRILLIGTFSAFSATMFGYNALAPIGLERHASIAIILSLAINIIAFSYIVISNQVNLMTVTIIVALSNVCIFAYRAAIFYKNRHLVKKF